MKPEVTTFRGLGKKLVMSGSYKRTVSCETTRRASPPEFAIGGLYFMLWYPDQDNQADQTGLFLIPESLVFVGRNLDADEERDTWYFQDTKSYCAHGAYPNNEERGLATDDYYGLLYALHEEDLFQVVDCQGLVSAVSKCMLRRKGAKQPV